jgi:hypothetical protein
MTVISTVPLISRSISSHSSLKTRMSYWVKSVELFGVNRTVALVFTLACASVVRAHSGALVQAWRYDPQKHLVEIRINNVSPKGITAFNMTVVMKHEDGTQTVGEAGADFSTGIGSLASERSLDTRLYSAKAVTNVEAVIDVILYADGTSEVQNKRAYDRIVTQRKNSQNGGAKSPEPPIRRRAS